MVSIIVPIYNSEKYLRECINSLINQTYKDIEMILIDDGSKDDSLSICKSYQNVDNRIKVISKKNSGVSSTRNAGIEYANGEWIMFVDSDDFLELEAVELSLREIEMSQSDIVIFNYYKTSRGQKEKINSVVSGEFSKRQFLINNYNNLNTVYYNKIYNKIYNKSIIITNNIRFPEEINMGEDLRFNLEYFSYCSRFLIKDDYLYNYRVDNEQSLMHTIEVSVSDIVEEIKCVYEFYLKNIDSIVDCKKGLDKFVLDKINVFSSNAYRNNINATSQLTEIIGKIKRFYDIDDFSGFKFKMLLKLGWIFTNGHFVNIRQIIIAKRYQMIMRIRGFENDFKN